MASPPHLPLDRWLRGLSVTRLPSVAAAGSSVLPAQLAPSVARAATRFAFSQSVATGSLPVAATELAQGVLTTMLFKKLTIAGCVVLSLGIATVGGGALLIGRTYAQDPKPGADGSRGEIRKPTTAAVNRPADDDPQLTKLLAAAHARSKCRKPTTKKAASRLTVSSTV